jgi:hypothetical protein
MDSGSPDLEEASDGAEGAQEDDARAEDAGTGPTNGSSDDAEAASSCLADSSAGSNACQVDPCSPDPCGAGFTCNRTPSATASCAATCASSELGCQLGDPCGTDEECRSGGDANASCDPTGKVCVTVCPTTSIVSQANLDAAEYCREIDGDLIVNPNFATIPASALPYLKRIRGRFNADLSGVPNTSAQSLTFGALQTIDGNLSFGLFQNVILLSFPRLTSVGGNLTIVLAQSLEHLSLPQLTTIQGNLDVGAAPISQFDIGRLQTVGGTLTIGAVCNLPWSQISRLGSVVANPTFANIGCCTGQTTRHNCTGGCTCN